MQPILVPDDLWAGAMLPEGVLERWRSAAGDPVAAGQVIAELRIEDALHELLSPAAGRLVWLADEGDVIDPGSLIGRVNASA